MNVKITKITCEHVTQPFGLDTPAPRFSWAAEADAGGGRQQAFQMLVSSDGSLSQKGKGDVWDSGWVESPDSAMVPYGGPALQEESDYWFRVRVRDISGAESDFSAPFRFGTAFFEPDQEHWRKIWLTPTRHTSCAQCFRRDFDVRKPLARARLYLAGAGYCQAFLNGAKVGDRELDPAWTDYTKSVMYTTFDVSGLLRQGVNALGIRMGGGWYTGASFKAPQLALRLHLFYQDGTDEWVESAPRGAWLVSCDGEVRENSIYDGETIDASLRRPGWDQPGYDVSSPTAGKWDVPLRAEAPGGKMKSQLLEPIRVVDSWSPKKVTEPAPHVYLLDAGQNISGWVSARISGKKGQRITLRFAEDLKEDGSLHTENLRSAKATDVFLLSGEGEDEFRPSFTFHGFRYVLVEGLESEPDWKNWKMEVVHSDVAPCGEFSCGNTLMNQIQSLCWWTECTNLMGLPTDCPQRDERLGWLNDMTVRAEEALYNFRLGGLYTKWLQDIEEAQGPDTGAITDTAPFHRYGCRPADPVCSSYLLLPWYLYLNYGDKKVLERHYEGMARWVGYLEEQADDGIVGFSYFGDWASPAGGAIPGSNGCGAVSAITPGALMSTGYLYFDARLMENIAALLGKEADVKRYAALAEKTAAAFQREFFHEEEGCYAQNSQASNVFALYLGLVPEERRKDVLAHIVEDIARMGGSFTTGNQCTKYLFDILSQNGYEDLAMQLATREEYPSWGYMIRHGATTVWERWEYVMGGDEIGMASMNHPMNAVVSVWFYKHLCGLRACEEGPGFSRFQVEPVFPRQLDSARARLDTVKGEVSVSWQRKDGALTLTVKIPYNSSAVVRLPACPAWEGPAMEEKNGKWECLLSAGVYTFRALSQAAD